VTQLPSRLERWLARAFDDDEPTAVGSGWMSGTASVFLGLVAALGALAFWFPGYLTTAEFRARYPVSAVRALLEFTIGLAFLLGAASLMMRRRKVLGLTGMGLSLVALLAGGGHVEPAGDLDAPFTIGLDWFALNVLLTALVFVPLERAFPLRTGQRTFRFGWATDAAHFLVSHLAVQTLSFLTLLPATSLARMWQPASLQHVIRALPLWAQFLGILLLSDLVQYWVHRAFHVVPALWRLHAVHHSSTAMDWLAGSRLHVFDVLVTRGLVLVPIFLLGFATEALYAYLVFVSFHAVFIHANVRFRFGWVDQVIATPRGHRLFGTQHLPADEWPSAYGIAGDPVPEGYLRQLAHPFRPAPPRSGEPSGCKAGEGARGGAGRNGCASCRR